MNLSIIVFMEVFIWADEFVLMNPRRSASAWTFGSSVPSIVICFSDPLNSALISYSPIALSIYDSL